MEHADQDIRRSIITEIESAFGEVRRGNAITLHQARVLDDYGDEQQQAEARKKDTETRWQDIPDSWIRKLSDALPFLDPEGFRYYIPAFMILDLKSYDARGNFLAILAKFALHKLGLYRTPKHDMSLLAVYFFGTDRPDEWEMARFRIMTEQQNKAIARYLDYFGYKADKEYSPTNLARKALDGYWRQFLKT